ncbi:uncharacterized protein LOC144166830 [Haemaphysalis longicornis]
MFSAAPKRGRSKRCKPQQLKLSLGSSSGASGSCLPSGPSSRGKSSGKDDAPMVSRTSTTCTMAGTPARGVLQARARAPEFLSKWPPLRERSSCCAPSLQASPRTLAALFVCEEGFYHQNERAVTCVDYHLDSERAPEFLSKWPPLRERSSCCASSLQASPRTLAALLVREEGFYHQNERAVTCVDYHLDSERAPEFLSKWPPLRERSSCCAPSLQASPRTLAALLVREEGFYHQYERAVTCVDYHLDSERAPEFLSKWPLLRERGSCCASSLQASPRTLAALLVRKEGVYRQNERAVTCVDYHLDSE